MLRTDALDVSYGGGGLVLRNVAVEVPEGSVVCLLGRNGVGKTTLLRTLAGVLRPRRGRVLMGEDDVSAWPSFRRARGGLAYVPQGRGIFPHLTLRENLLLGAEALAGRGGGGRADVEASLELFPGLGERLQQQAGTLSGGQQQQLAIARALVSEPRWLLLDEPTEGIQPSIVEEIESAILRIRSTGTTAILLVEQYLDFALRVADTCYLMDQGRIVLSGGADDVEREQLQAYLAL